MYALVQSPCYPFTAVVGQSLLKKALLLLAVNPRIGGLLISGPRGCAKTTLARSVIDVLPAQDATFVNLPLGVSEEMLLGTLDLQQVLAQQQVNFKPGLLAKAHNGVLYIDEVNLLTDDIVDLLLDVTASGVNYVERDGISHSHPAKFILLGTMNPDEGDVRPQLLDRFGFGIELASQYSIADRISIVQRREAFDNNPEAFYIQFQQEQESLQDTIATAQAKLTQIDCSDEIRHQIAERCVAAQVEGLRADLVWYRAAIAHAAWLGKERVDDNDIIAVAPLVLQFRGKVPPSDSDSAPPKATGSQLNDPKSYASPLSNQKHNEVNNQKYAMHEHNVSHGDWGAMKEPQLQPMANTKYDLPMESQQNYKPPSLRRNILYEYSKCNGKGTKGNTVSRSISNRVNWFATLSVNKDSWPLKHLKYKTKLQGQLIYHLVLLDTSASTLSNQLFAQAKALVLSIANSAYLARDTLNIFAFGEQKVTTITKKILAPKQLHLLLDQLAAGGGTPLRQALLYVQQYLKQLRRKIPSCLPRIYIVTDGRSTQKVSDIRLWGQSQLIDIEQSVVRRGRGKAIANAIGAEYINLQALTYDI